jgi:hypothetical protein
VPKTPVYLGLTAFALGWDMSGLWPCVGRAAVVELVKCT